jgi:OmcA/MtrC family decaheme c-type cytochrome
MSNTTMTNRGRTLSGLLVALVAGLALAACSGSDGATGPTGPAGPAGPAGSSGPPGTSGPPGGGQALDISFAQTVTAIITSVTGGSTPTVAFNLVSEKGEPLAGLQASQLRFAIARLTPGSNGASSYWTSYVNTVQQPGSGAWWGTTPTRQATAEAATAGTFVDNLNGSYTYKFAKDLGAYTPADAQGAAVAYDGTLTTRVGLEIKGTGPDGTNNAINNAVYTYQPSTGNTTGILTRDIVNNAECNACHDKLQFHGGPRTDVQYCVLCHNPGTTDAQSGNLVDLKVLVHKLHSGVNLPTVIAAGSTAPAQGVGYVIWGYSNKLYNFNTIVFPQDRRNCTTCHRASDPTTPDADNYKNVPYSAACGTCHDNVNFATGLNHSTSNLGGFTDADCITCHGPNATQGGGAWTVVNAHTIPEKVAGTKFQYNIVAVVDAATGGALANGSQLKITYSVTDPTNANAPYTLATASAFSGTDGGGIVCRPGGSARLALDVAWSTSDYTNFGSGALPAQPWSFNPLASIAGCNVPPATTQTITGPDANGVYTLVTSVAGGLPAGIGTIGVVFEGHPAVDTKNVGTTAGTSWQRIAVKNTVSFVNVNDTAVVARRNVVDIAKCDECHNALSVHGNNRTDNPEACVACHNSGATDGNRRKGIQASGVTTGFDPVDGLYEQSIDFKYMIHGIHAADLRASNGAPPFVVYGYGGSRNDFGDVGFPGAINNCEGCHVAGAYDPVDGTKVQATTFSTGTTVNPLNPNPVAATSANMAVCSACHTTTTAATHMVQNGGSRMVQKDAFGRTIAGASIETCAICHGQGQVADVKVVHKVGQYIFN